MIIDGYTPSFPYNSSTTFLDVIYEKTKQPAYMYMCCIVNEVRHETDLLI